LKRSEARVKRLSAIVESSGDAIMANDASGKVVGWNRGAESMYGWSADEAVGQPSLFMVPHDRAAAEQERLKRAVAGEVLQAYETVHLRKDGAPIDVSVSHAPLIDEHNQIV